MKLKCGESFVTSFPPVHFLHYNPRIMIMINIRQPPPVFPVTIRREKGLTILFKATEQEFVTANWNQEQVVKGWKLSESMWLRCYRI